MPTIKTKTKFNNTDYGISIEEMIEKGVLLGHHTSYVHPKMAPYILGKRNTSHVLDLKKTAVCLREALDFISFLKEKNGTLLFVGTKPPLRHLVRQTAQDCKMPYVVNRWLGGTFTNFKVISERAKYFKEIEEKQKTGELKKYTKKEQVRLAREIENLRKKFEGIKDMDSLPDAVFICDVVYDLLALKEARSCSICTIGIADTNADPTLLDYPIPANDDAIPSVKYILDKVKAVLLDKQNNK